MLPARLASALVIALAASTPAGRAESEITTFSGCCDASAAVAVDERHFVVADDEDNILRVYKTDGRFDRLSELISAPPRRREKSPAS
jgi:hypothetical protein